MSVFARLKNTFSGTSKEKKAKKRTPTPNKVSFLKSEKAPPTSLARDISIGSVPAPPVQSAQELLMASAQPEPKAVIPKDGKLELLPPELWLHVFENLDGINLSNIALLNSAYQRLVLPILYRDLKLFGAGLVTDRFPNKTSGGIQKLLETPELAELVRTCHVSRWSFAPVGLDKLLELLITLPNIHTLRLTNNYVGEAVCTIISLMKPLRVLSIEACNVELSEPIDPPPELQSLTISQGAGSRPNAIACFARSPKIQVFSLSTIHHHQVILGHFEKSPLAITDLRLCIFTEAHAISAAEFLTHSCPNLQRLTLIPGRRSLTIPPEAIPRLRVFKGEFSTAPNIVPGRPISELDLMLGSSDDATCIQRAFDSLISSKAPIRKLRIEPIYVDANMLDFLSEHFVDLEELVIPGLEQLDVRVIFSASTCASISRLTRLRTFRMECLNAEDSDNALQIEKWAIDQMQGTMPQLSEIAFTKSTRWTKRGERWTSYNPYGF